MVSQVQAKAEVLVEKIERVLPKTVALRDVLVFLGGAEAFHTLTHVWLGLSGMLPMTLPFFPSIEITQGLNVFAIVVNAIFTAGLLYWATRLKK